MGRLGWFQDMIFEQLAGDRFIWKRVFGITKTEQMMTPNWEEMIIHNQVHQTIQGINQEGRNQRHKCYLPIQSRPYTR